MTDRVPLLRGVLLAIVVFISAVDALPLQTPPSRRVLREPAVHDELVRIADGLESVGVTTDAKAVEDFVFNETRRTTKYRTFLLKPFKGFRRITGTGQAWGFFGYPETYPYWLVVEGKTADGDWERLYSPRTQDDLLRSKLRFRRLQFMFVDVVRGTRQDAVMGRLADRVAPEVFALRPDLDTVRVYIHREKTPKPGKTAKKPPEKKWVQTRQREDTP